MRRRVFIGKAKGGSFKIRNWHIPLVFTLPVLIALCLPESVQAQSCLGSYSQAREYVLGRKIQPRFVIASSSLNAQYSPPMAIDGSLHTAWAGGYRAGNWNFTIALNDLTALQSIELHWASGPGAYVPQNFEIQLYGDAPNCGAPIATYAASGFSSGQIKELSIYDLRGIKARRVVLRIPGNSNPSLLMPVLREVTLRRVDR